LDIFRNVPTPGDLKPALPSLCGIGLPSWISLTEANICGSGFEITTDGITCPTCPAITQAVDMVVVVALVVVDVLGGAAASVPLVHRAAGTVGSAGACARFWTQIMLNIVYVHTSRQSWFRG